MYSSSSKLNQFGLRFWPLMSFMLTFRCVISALCFIGPVITLTQLLVATQSALYPAFNVILGKWSLDGEFAVLFSIAWSGGYFGSASSFPISSALCQSSFLGGWPAIFYLSGRDALKSCQGSNRPESNSHLFETS